LIANPCGSRLGALRLALALDAGEHALGLAPLVRPALLPARGPRSGEFVPMPREDLRRRLDGPRGSARDGPRAGPFALEIDQKPRERLRRHAPSLS
jgi:hypothetical protein